MILRNLIYLMERWYKFLYHRFITSINYLENRKYMNASKQTIMSHKYKIMFNWQTYIYRYRVA